MSKAKKSKAIYKKNKRSKSSKKQNFIAKLWKNKLFRFIAKYALAALIIVAFFTAIYVAYCVIDLPNIEKLSKDTSKPHIIIRAESGEVLAHYGDFYGRALTYGQLPRPLIEAVLATEDRRFFDHSGIDYFGILRAMYKNRMAGRVVQGGSTLTQQLAKMIFLSSERTMKRKVQEALLAIQLERLFSKEQIMAMYLNRVYLGHANYGVDSAARNYFGKRTEELTLYESAFIAGMLKAPTRYAPPYGIELALGRAKQVLVNMADAGFITQRQMEGAKLPVFINKARPRGSLENPFFTDYIMSELPGIVDNIKQDLDVQTAFSLEMQSKLEAAIQKSFLKNKQISDHTQIAAVVMNTKGEIKAMVGGRDYAKSQFNRAVNAKRQAGSTFKLFVYLAALENGYHIDQQVEDAPITIGKWRPQNYSRKFMGSVSLIDAFAYSLNTVVVRLSEDIGRNEVISMAYRLGIHDQLPNMPSIALGSGEVTMLDLVSAYAAIFNNGYIVENTSIQYILDARKHMIYKHHENSVFSTGKVLDDNVLRQIKDMLAASTMYGTSKGAAVEGKKIYGKTGTSQDYKDAWFIGNVDDLVVGVWIGNDNNEPMNRITGGKTPAEVFKAFVSNL